MVPASGWWAPAMTLISVDLPAPFSPTKAWTSPARRSNDTPLSAWTPANALLIPVNSNNVDTDRSPWSCGPFQISDSKFQIPDSRFQIPDSRTSSFQDGSREFVEFREG